MLVRLFISLVFLSNILADDISSQIFEPSPDHLAYDVHIPRKLVNEPAREPPGGAAIAPIKNTNNKQQNKPGTNVTGNKTKEDLKGENSEAVISYPPYGSYQVTENVIDIPDNRTRAGPIDPYYTVRPELNIANGTDKPITTVANNKGKEKKNRVTIHFDAEYEKEEIKENKVVGFLKGVKECFETIQKGVVDGFWKFFHRNDEVTVINEKY